MSNWLSAKSSVFSYKSTRLDYNRFKQQVSFSGSSVQFSYASSDFFSFFFFVLGAQKSTTPFHQDAINKKIELQQPILIFLKECALFKLFLRFCSCELSGSTLAGSSTLGSLFMNLFSSIYSAILHYFSSSSEPPSIY